MPINYPNIKPIYENHIMLSLHHIAAQMWNFAIYLPLMVGDQIPSDDSDWECYLLLLDILKICMA